MTITKIPSLVQCYSEEYRIEAFESWCCFQVFNGKIEYVTDYEMYSWAIGKTIVDVELWVKNKEEEELNEKVKSDKSNKEYISIHKKRQLLYQEEHNKRKKWESHHWVEDEKGNGHFEPSFYKL